MSYSTINYIFSGLFIIAALILWWKSRRMSKPINWEELSDHVLISISVPKNNDRTPQAAEQMFSALHGIFRDGASEQIHISFELVAKAKTIKFYCYLPTDSKDFVVSQIFAQYPNVEVKEIAPEEDYTNLSDTKKIASTELTLKRSSALPIKTFQNFEVDPLSAITGVLSSVGQDEDLWIQFLIKPIDDDWQDIGNSEIKKLKNPQSKPKSFLELIGSEIKELSVGFFKVLIKGALDDPEKKEVKKEEENSVSQVVKAVEEKITKLGFTTNIRILASANDEHTAQSKLEQVVGAFKQFNTLNLNAFTTKEISYERKAFQLFKQRFFGDSEMIFNVTELASLYHFPADSVVTPTIAWAGSRKGEPPANLPIVGTVPADELTVFGETNYRNEIRKFGIKKKDRRLHTYVIGKTGTGKSTLLENMIIDDIYEGRGMAVVDPHGSLVQHVLEFIPESRIQDVIYFNPADSKFPVGFNLLESVDPEQKNIVASGVVGILEKIFGEVSWGPRLEYILRNVVLALLEYPGSTFLGIMRLLTDSAYRRMVLNEVKDPIIRDFFINEYEKYDPKFRTEAIAPIQNKVGQFLSASTIRNIIGQPKSTIDIRKVMDEGKILLADLSIGKIGEDNSALLGSMLITKIQLAAMGRVNVEEADRRDFYLYVDEFQNFATDSFATILSEARKYRLNLAMANQYTAQMPESVSNAVFGNVGTMISFRVGAQDADTLVKEMEPVFDANDLVNLDNFQIYLKMAIDGVTVPAFSASTLPPRTDKTNLTDRIIESSRKIYSKPLDEVEDYIAEWSTPINLTEMSDGTPKEKSKQREDRGSQSTSENVVEKKETVRQAEEGSSQTERADESSEQGRERKMTLPENSKIEILKDRFDRAWYAVATNEEKSQRGESDQKSEIPSSNIEEKNIDITDESGGETDKNDHLITWDDVEELDIKVPQSDELVVKNPAPDEELLPLDEIR